MPRKIRRRQRSDGNARRSTRRAEVPGLTLRPRELSELVGVPAKTLQAWLAAGLLPHFRTPGGHLRFVSAVVLPRIAVLRSRAEKRSGSRDRHRRDSKRR